jgi:glycosyltransferase involved in cell wall biosynthesis
LRPLRVGWSATLTCDPLSRGTPDGIGVYTRELLASYARMSDVTPVPVVMGPRAARHAPSGAVILPRRHSTATALSWATGVDFRGASQLAERVDVYHATDYRVPRLRHTPVCATLFDAIPLSHPEWASAHLRELKNFLLRESARWADQVIAISDAMVPELNEQFGIERERITVTPLGVDGHWFARESGVRIAEVRRRHGLDDVYLLFVGTLQPRKNVARILAAYERLPAPTRSHVQLVIAGKVGWRADELMASLRVAQAGGRVRWLDYVDAGEMPALYQGAAGFVFPSLYEGFGLPVLEAFASGIPVITSNTTSLPEVAGSAALLVDPTDIDALTEAMGSVIGDSALASRLAAAGLERAKGYSWARCAGATVAVLRSLL